MNWTRHSSCLMFAVALGLAACASKQEDPVNKPIVDEKYKLSADRKAFQDIRAQVPEDRRRENDELAFMLQWMGEVRQTPSEIREKFNAVVAKKRAEFQKDMDRKRAEYVKSERIAREDFKKDQESERANFKNRRTTPDERKSFYEDLEGKRRDFYSSEREKRDAFESDVRDQRKNFDDYVREKTSEFNQEHRAYSQRYDDFKKEQARLKKEREDAVRQSREQDKIKTDSDFKEMDGKTPRPLGTDE